MKKLILKSNFRSVISNNKLVHHSDLFSDNVEKQLKAAAIMSERLKKRKIILKKKED